MLKDVKWTQNQSYKTGSSEEPFLFYMECLINSNRLDLLLGYFSTSAIHVLALGFAKFISSGGILRMIINDVLSDLDREVIIEGQSNFQLKEIIDLKNLFEIRRKLDIYGIHFFECIAYLISENRIQIKIIKPKYGHGISHYKSGIFHDSDNSVGFNASCNFTSSGLLANLEEIEAYLSWEEGKSNRFVLKQSEYFMQIYSEQVDFVEYIDAHEVKAAIYEQFGSKDLSHLILQENELFKQKNSQVVTRISEVIEQYLENTKESEIDLPCFPFPSGPREYQITAYKNWVNNNYQGLFAMATGTGKTITALNCIYEQYKITNTYKFIILVPTIALGKQWQKEVTEKFNFTSVTVCSSKETNWEDGIEQIGRNLRYQNNSNFCIIITYASFRGKRFQNLIKRNFTEHLTKMTLIADEAHTFGAKGLINLLPLEIIKRIGLSATPERVYDQEGQTKLSEYFNSYSPRHTFVYDMKMAIEDNILCRYYYYPILVDLEDDELAEYKKISRKLAKFINTETGRYIDNPTVNSLLIRRKNIIHKANRKESALINIVTKIGGNNLKYAFIYVPEGNKGSYDEVDETFSEQEDSRIIDHYTTSIHNQFGLKLRKFLGETTDREAILSQFEKGEINAILAMKCLDEGIDIPRAQYAIFCSSTGNPRQYIQRRGRVLRVHKDKEFAFIYDMIIKPSISFLHGDSNESKMERNIFMSELKRLTNFTALAENRIEILSELELLATSYNIDIYDLMNIELENYDI